MLYDALVIWGGEFGRTVYSQVGLSKDSCGREHHWHVRDFNATLLHLLGIDHEKLTIKCQGLDQKFTGVIPAEVVPGLLS